MNTWTQKKSISPEEESVIDSSSSGQVTVATRKARAPLKTFVVMKPRLPAAIPEERLDYYAWVSSARIFESGNDLRTVSDGGGHCPSFRSLSRIRPHRHQTRTLHLTTPTGDGEKDNLLARLEFTNTAIEGGLFHDIGIVPAQFYPGRRDAAQTEPIRKLMTAILVDAVQCYRTGQRQIVKGIEALEANIWIFGSYGEFPFSFTNVCTELGLSPDHIRKQLRDSDTQAQQTQDDPASGNTDTQGKRRGPSITAFIKAEERGSHLWIQRVTSPTTTIRQFPIFRKRTPYSRGGGPF